MKAFPALALSSLLLAGCAQTPPGTPVQSGNAANAPSIAVGDSWTYRVRDGYTGLDRGTATYRVTDAGPQQVTVAVFKEGNGTAETVEIYNREWDWIRRPATNLPVFTYNPPYQAYRFPLTPGKTWRMRGTATDPRDGRSFPVLINAEVMGWERIKVPAGEFEALKVRRQVYLNYWEITVREGSDIVEIEWYAPAAKQAVRRETSSQYISHLFVFGRDGGPSVVRDDWLIAELTNFSVR